MIDPVTLAVINNNLVNICREMGITMIRTAFSPIFNEGLDFTCALADAKGDMIACAEFCPTMIGGMLFPDREVVLFATYVVIVVTLVGLFAVLAAVPLAVHNPYALGLLTLLAIYGILLIGLDVTVGYLGQVNLAQAAFLGLGAYTAGLCVTKLGWGMPLATVAAI